MKKIYKKPLSLLLSVLMVFSAITFLFMNADVYVVAAQTETASDKVIGDADGSGELNIQDATSIQLYLANLISEDGIDLIAANVTGNEKLSINDATEIQLFLAELINKFPVEDVSDKVQLTFNVTIPEPLEENDNLSIGTNLNNWNPADSGWFMTQIDDLHYQYSVELDTESIGKEISYKYTIQNSRTTGYNVWARVEGSSTGGDISNRTFVIDKNSNVISDTVAMFKNGLDNTTVTSGTLETFTLDMPQYSDSRTKITDGKIELDNDKCNFCGRCYKACPTEAWDTVNGYIVSFGGLFGNSINKGETIIPFIEDKEKLMNICDAAIHFFEDNANAGERFKFTIDRVGKDKFEKTILEAYNG